MATEQGGASQGSFRNKILGAAGLSTLRYGSDVMLRLVSTIVLTRLLAPEIYGVFAIVVLYLYLLEMLSDLGIRTLIITKEGTIEDDFLSTCWTVFVLRGFLMTAVSLLLAFGIWTLQAQGVFAPESSYAAPVLPWAIAVGSIAPFLSGFYSPMRFVRQREMQFSRDTLMVISVNFVGLLVTIILAVQLRSVWALVLGNIVKNVVMLYLSHRLFPGLRMRFRLDMADLKLIWGRGKWIMGMSTMTSISQSADRLMLGLVMSSATFGFYFIARQISDIAISFLNSLDTQMGLQVFSHILKSTKEQFRKNYYRYRLVFDAISGMCSGGMFVLAPLLVELIFDDRYQDIAPILQLLVLNLLLVGPLMLRSGFYAERRFRLMTGAGVVSAVTLWVGLIWATMIYQNMTAAILVYALHRLPEAFLYAYLGWRKGWIVPWREGTVFVFFAAGAAMGWGIVQLWDMVAS